MKKILFSLSMLPALAMAQTTSDATLNVRLNAIMSIEVNTPNVLAEFKTKADYLNGVDVAKPSHLTTFSTQGYQVLVKSLGSNLQGSVDALDLSTVTITGDSNFAHVVYNPVSLSETPQQFFRSTIGAGQKLHNVNYNFHGQYWDKKADDYSVTVLYEITTL